MSVIRTLTPLEKDSILRGIPIIGHEKGIWLLKKVQDLQPKRILELGTANGYSGIILGSDGAKLLTIEIDAQIATEAEENFSEFNIDAKIVVGNAVEEIKKLEGEFDLIFIDFAKKKYIEVLEPAIALLRLGGLIIADNISMKNCQDFKEAVITDKSLKTEIIDIKDGLSCSEKI